MLVNSWNSWKIGEILELVKFFLVGNAYVGFWIDYSFDLILNLRFASIFAIYFNVYFIISFLGVLRSLVILFIFSF